MTPPQRRVARKKHRCCRTIQPGEVYLVWTAFPGDDCLEGLRHPVRMAECSDCAERYGRGHLLVPAQHE